jgi:acyl-coenzyme A thioesterase THEM4
VATVLDEIMGILLVVNAEYALQLSNGSERITQMTAYLNVSYKRPVRTPGVVLATARIMKAEGKKWWIRATIEDSERQELAVAEALFVNARADPRL